MSLSKLCKISEKGVEFQSHIDGCSYVLTPEKSIEIQRMLDSDITMVLDECTKPNSSYDDTQRAMELSVRWARRSKDAFIRRNGYAIFGITQGANYKDLRHECLDKLIEIGFDGYAVGGCVGSGEKLFEVLDWMGSILPEDKPRYVMGIGEPLDLIGAVLRGFDMFDCILPTRSARHGIAYTLDGKIKMRKLCYMEDDNPLDIECICPACTQFSKAYLNHLVRANEILGAMLLTWHNVQFYQNLMSELRRSIKENRLSSFADDFLYRF